MFFLTYLFRELRWRARQALVIVLGLALGVGLVVAVTGAANGVHTAQGTVLHALYGVGTSLTITKGPAAPKSGQSPPGMITIGPGGKTSGGVVSGGTIENLENADLGTIQGSAVGEISKLQGVSAAAGALVLNDFKVALPSGSPGTGTKPTGSAGSATFSVAGVDVTQLELGPLSAGRIIGGRAFSLTDETRDVAIVDSGYAISHGLHVGSTVTITQQSFTVIGVVRQPEGSNPPNVYVPLARAQALYAASTGVTSDAVNTIFVATPTAADDGMVQHEIKRMLPSATVTGPGDLANELTGSLSSAETLVGDLGRWLAIIVMVAAVAIASLLTLGAVARRVREFGTLRALGWRGSRISAQVMGESLTVGILGGALGAGLGYLATRIITALAPNVPATFSPTSQTPGNGLFLGGHLVGATASRTVPVHLTAPVSPGVLLLAVSLAIAAGVVAGLLASWRIARLRPADALARVA